LVGDSFVEGAIVTFACNQDGYEPRENGTDNSTGLECIYNNQLDTMEWSGVMPECVGKSIGLQ